MINFLLTNFKNSDTPFNINSLINKFSRDTDVLDYHDIKNQFEISPDMSFNILLDIFNSKGTIKFALKDFIWVVLNTWKDSSILNPVSPFVLDTQNSFRSS